MVDGQHINLTDVDRAYRVRQKGEYNVFISTCSECWHSDIDIYESCVGFATPSQQGMKATRHLYTVAMVVECPKCSIRYWFHAYKQEYETFLGNIVMQTKEERDLFFKVNPTNKER